MVEVDTSTARANASRLIDRASLAALTACPFTSTSQLIPPKILGVKSSASNIPLTGYPHGLGVIFDVAGFRWHNADVLEQPGATHATPPGQCPGRGVLDDTVRHLP